ncbi:MAG: MFS transporter [Anaerolineales bacterium]|nr:MFS transporter [Chloroflexota bacterium]MBL6982838.1 MFS transporter [Anaerolineales bacterium]
MKKFRTSDLFTINTYWFGLSTMWNSLHVIILPAILLNFVPETRKNTYLGLLTFVGLIIAMIVQPISGSISDRWRSRWGRRRPLIALGTILDFIFLAVLGWAGGLIWIAIGYIGLQFTSNIAHGPAQGLLPDQIPSEKHGAASGIKNLFDMSGLVAASLIMGNLLDPEAIRALVPIIVIAGVLLISAAVTIFGTREHSNLEASPNEKTETEQISLTRILADNPQYAKLIVSRYAFLIGIYAVQSFAQYFIRDVIITPNPIKLTGDLMAAIALPLIAFAIGGGWIGDRVGHRRLLYIASGIGILGSLLLMTARTPIQVLIYGAILGLGIGLFLTSNWAMLSRMAPIAQAGAYLGLTNLATAGSAASGRLIGPAIDWLNNINPGDYNGYTAMFAFGAASILLSVILLTRVSAE